MVENSKNEETVSVEVQEDKVPQLPTHLSEVDKMALNLAKTNRLLVLEQAKTALANNEKAESDYKYIVLQLYLKYGLTISDSISEDGTINRG